MDVKSLDQISHDSASGSSTIDPKGYLTSLDSQILKTSTEIGDIKKARSLFESIIKTNPKHAPAWVGAARVEQFANRIVSARKIIDKGCEECSESEDVWLEAATLHVSRKHCTP
jgi:pre-mRNA-processing factor 6